MRDGKVIVGLDIGYGGLKVVCGRDDFRLPELGRGMYAKRASAAPAAIVNRPVLGEDDGYEVTVGGELFKTCFDPARVISAARSFDEGYPSTKEYRALFHTALSLTGRAEIDILVTGLPVEHWKDKVARSALEASMEGVHAVSPGRSVTVKKAIALPQPYGGFMVYYYDVGARDGGENEALEATVVVIDPGAYSVDWSVFAKANPLDELNSSSAKASIVLLERVALLLREERRADVNATDLETALIKGKDEVFVAGTKVALKPYLDRAAAEIVPGVMGQIVAKVRQSGRSVDRVILVGGGAPFYKSAAEESFGKDNVRAPEPSSLTNAKGFYYYGCQLAIED